MMIEVSRPPEYASTTFFTLPFALAINSLLVGSGPGCVHYGLAMHGFKI
jgi:hypothetical protein